MPNTNNLPIQRVRAVNGRWLDLMDGCSRIACPVHEHGHVDLVDCMPRLIWVDPDRQDDLNTAEAAIVQAARVSYQKGTRKVSEDRGLVRYLMRNDHNTPVEMVETKWHAKMPIFVARQWIRHRTASVNEVSARYSELPGEFWIPKAEALRAQGKKNKQVSEGEVDQVDAKDFVRFLEDTCDRAYTRYESALKKGIGREIARVGLPLNIYTEWYWKIDLHNLFHFLKLRVHEHAQQEIRDYALPMLGILRSIAPVACEAFEDFRVNSVTLTGPEVEAIRDRRASIPGERENTEFQAKLKRLDLIMPSGPTI